VNDWLQALKSANAGNAVVLVVDNRSGDILAWLGSADFFNARHQGQVNGVLARRQPGSTLKPFTYLLALENGYTASSILPDIPLSAPTPGGLFAPANYDRRYHGPVRLRTALACSYNVPAVYLANRLGPEALLLKLHRAGFLSLDKPAEFYGPGLTLGNGEVTLLELVRAYAGLAAQGRLPALRLAQGPMPILPPHFRRAQDFGSPAAAALVAGILADKNARIPAFGEGGPFDFPFACAVKTGTTKNFRDNWAIGFTTDYTAGVWVGNFDGAPMRHISGISGAGPIFRDVMLLLHAQQLPADFPLPSELVAQRICPDSGLLPGPACPQTKSEWFIAGTEPKETCAMHQVIADPRTGEFKLALLYPAEYRQWARDQGMPQPLFLAPSARVQPVLAVQALAPRRPVILFPANGDIFKLDPVLHRLFQKLQFQASVPAGVARVTWFLDGQAIGSAGPPFSIFWPMQPGVHTLTARANGMTSRPVTFRVLE